MILGYHVEHQLCERRENCMERDLKVLQDSGQNNDWYEEVKDYTLRLVAIRSVSPSQQENRVAEEVLRLLCDGGLASVYTAYGLDALEDDPYQRQNAYAFLRGNSSKMVILLGHIDTVDTKDYGPLEEFALDPLALTAKQQQFLAEDVVLADAADWLYGRGVADMKSGVAANIAVMRRLAQLARASVLPLSVLLLATPDEENESAGVLQAVRFLRRLQDQYQLDFVGAVNTDYTTALYAGDPHHYVYTGTVGKLLPSYLCVGRESHVGDPFKGVDANLLMAELIRDVSMNDDLCDRARGEITSPPVTLHATDLKSHYDVQLPFMAYFYLNVLTFSTDPQTLLVRLKSRAEGVLASLLAKLDETERRWLEASQDAMHTEMQARSGQVFTYAEIYEEVVQRLGRERVEAELEQEWQRWPATLDKRERSLYGVRRLWAISGKRGPAVVLYYAPPYYPHAEAVPGALHDAVLAVAQAHPEAQLKLREYYPYLSDMSYLRLDAGVDLLALKANMPVWYEQGSDIMKRPGSYYLPLEAIQQLNIPVVNFGPYGRGVHQRDEGLATSYSFGLLPQLLYETVLRLL